jgi:hypothetical protein
MSLTPRLDRAEPNKIINGNFDFWQRGTSLLIAAGASDKNYLADRWSHTSFFASGSITVSRSVDIPSGLKDATYSMSTAITTAVSVAHASNNYSINAGIYRMEGYDAAMLHGKTVTLQFWVKSSLTGSYSIGVGSNFDTGITSASYVSTYTVNVANTWEQKSITLLIDSTTGSFAKDNTQGLFIGFGLAARAGGSRETSVLNQWVTGGTAYVASTANRTDFIGTIGNTIRIAQVKLSIGSGASDFSWTGRTYADELNLCQRYYEKNYPIASFLGTNMGNTGGTVAAEDPNAVLHCLTGVPFKVVKRASPAINICGSDGVIGNTNGWQDASAIRTVAAVSASEQGIAHVQLNTSADRLMRYYFTADAEL